MAVRAPRNANIPYATEYLPLFYSPNCWYLFRCTETVKMCMSMRIWLFILLHPAIILLLLLSLLLRIIYSIACCGASVARPFASAFLSTGICQAASAIPPSQLLDSPFHLQWRALAFWFQLTFSFPCSFDFASRAYQRSPISRKCRFAFVFFLRSHCCLFAMKI